MARPHRTLTNQWLAIDATTPVRTRARELRNAWESFVGAGEAAAVRIPILRSWERSHAAGVDPFRDRAAPMVGDADEVAAQWAAHPLAAAAPLILECLGAAADEARDLIAVTDAEGILLWVEGNRHERLAAAERMNFTTGARWSEGGAGTNAIGITLAAGHAVQVFAAEHFNEGVQAWTCAAAPVHDPDSGELLGVINLTGRAASANPHSYTCVVATARALESQLRSEMQERDFNLRSRYGELVAGKERRALATATGRVLTDHPEDWVGEGRLALPPGGGELVLPSGVPAVAEPVGSGEAYIVRGVDATHVVTPRRLELRLLGRDRALIERGGGMFRLTHRLSEVLALLAVRPSGMTSEELAADLYGDAGRPGAVRVEVHRLRQVLGGAVETDPYRLAVDVESDVARIRELLDRGATVEAAARYDGPLLPHSEAPGIVRDRDALDAWLRNAVMTGDDADALWAWVRCPSGCDDLPAWKRLLAHLDFCDPRRSLAATQLASLRAAFAVPSRPDADRTGRS